MFTPSTSASAIKTDPGAYALKGSLQVPGDKSIGHRALLFSVLCPGESRILGLPDNADVNATRGVLTQLGIQIQQTTGNGETVTLVQTPEELNAPSQPLDCQNSGTTMRLMMGLLSGLNLPATLVGDESLSKRPMKRVMAPLRMMGAEISADPKDPSGERPPITIQSRSTPLKPLYYKPPLASAQVKSALILAGLFADGVSTLAEPIETRTHTETLLLKMGAPVFSSQGLITIQGQPKPAFQPQTWTIPGDISSAAFWIVLATLLPGSDLTLKQVGVNPSRLGLIRVLQKAGAAIELLNPASFNGEAVADIHVEARPLKGNINLSTKDIPALIDEIPILAVAAVFLEGTISVRGAEELRKKESDRIQALVDEFQKLGIEIQPTDDGFDLTGKPHRKIEAPLTLLEKPLEAHHDHRIAMALTVLNVLADPAGWLTAPWPLNGAEWMTVSYPGFYDELRQRLASQN